MVKIIDILIFLYLSPFVEKSKYEGIQENMAFWEMTMSQIITSFKLNLQEFLPKEFIADLHYREISLKI